MRCRARWGRASAPVPTRLRLETEVGAARRHGGPGERALPRWTKKSAASLKACPTYLDPDVPDGPDETANVVLKQHGEPRDLGFQPKQHFELGEALGMMDFATAAKLAGARFVVLRGPLARLERALGQFMIDLHTREHGHTEMVVPSLVNDATPYGTGQLPKFARRPVPHDRWAMADPHGGGAADQYGRRRDRGGKGSADPTDGADRLLPCRGGRRGTGYARHVAPASVSQGGAGVDRSSRPQRGRAGAHGVMRREGAEPARTAVPPCRAVVRRHRLSAPPGHSISRSGCPASRRGARSVPPRTVAIFRRGG